MSETIRLQPTSSTSLETWVPVSDEGMAHLRGVLIKEGKLPDAEAWASVEGTASAILARCLPPDPKVVRQRTGLVVGYVQSGKTISMTSVACLARDNGFGLVVVLAGTTDNLHKQSWKRFRDYLQTTDGPRRLWYMLSSADHELQKNAGGLRSALASWRAKGPGSKRASAFLVVMKNYAHLDQLDQVLSQAEVRDIPTLVIDDEADQAGLNTKQNGAPSTTYAQIRRVRQTLGLHTYLQYTATPQAPLLISIADHLSPDFSVVLEPGKGYTGGRTFFVERPQLVESIPENDLFKSGSPPTEPPESLLTALRTFMVGVALGFHREGQAGANRSMLVHPSTQQADHDHYHRWVVLARDRWKETLRLPDTDPDRGELEAEFESAAVQLRAGGAEIPPIAELGEELRSALEDTQVHKVNSETGAEVDWTNGYSHILVGGQKLNRGYTVEGLTVTYMPRSAGTWTADTIQQLARFFGYKQKYLPLCRAYLNPDVVDVFRAYVDHEEDLRGQLRQFPGPLKEWTRQFYLDQRVKPTRASVITDRYLRINPEKWFIQNAPFDEAILDDNRRLTAALLAQVEGTLSDHPEAARHKEARISLARLADFLFSYRIVGEDDEAHFQSARYIIGQMLARQPELPASLVVMGSADRTARSGEIVKLHQGYDRKTMGRDYPGAGKVRSAELVTLQLFDLQVKVEETGESIPNVPTIALRLPSDPLVKSILHQPQSAAHADG